ncbi:EscI/YscI/HrpB family type III secretion system inner rod protein [Chitinivorax sp. B]|uniref:EscI/YscI/HrpB family type III secretion system inner rod protein n=1 Tax=Chitinivorax sp. B TaxID=2502235 RepID=UPI0010F61FCE|nr:EscI/YscI/HrpB family type III secretion system inner rod protein [Chitinivorax sp. B]
MKLILNSPVTIDGSSLMDTPVSIPSAADMALFRSMLNADLGQGDLSAKVVNGLTKAAGQFGRDQQALTREVRRAERSMDPQDIMRAAQVLSNYNNEMALSVKVISKATQSLDQLSKLQ